MYTDLLGHQVGRCLGGVANLKAVLCVIEIIAVHIEDCEGWWLSGCHGSVAEHWQLKPEVS